MLCSRGMYVGQGTLRTNNSFVGSKSQRLLCQSQLQDLLVPGISVLGRRLQAAIVPLLLAIVPFSVLCANYWVNQFTMAPSLTMKLLGRENKDKFLLYTAGALPKRHNESVRDQSGVVQTPSETGTRLLRPPISSRPSRSSTSAKSGHCRV